MRSIRVFIRIFRKTDIALYQKSVTSDGSFFTVFFFLQKNIYLFLILFKFLVAVYRQYVFNPSQQTLKISFFRCSTSDMFHMIFQTILCDIMHLLPDPLTVSYRRIWSLIDDNAGDLLFSACTDILFLFLIDEQAISFEQM